MTETEKQEKHEYLMEMQSLYEDCYVDVNADIEYPPIAISFGQKEYHTKEGVKYFPIPIATYGNFSFVQAPPKSLKTFFMSLLSAVYANKDCSYTGDLVSHRDNKSLIHFDTEQGMWHSQRVFKRVLDMNKGLDTSFYHTYALRSLTTTERLNFIGYILEELSDKGDGVGLVIIDGIADLVTSVNDEESCKTVVQKIMTWTVKYKCHITTVIHSNWGSDKPTGHLGSALEKKAETQIQLKKNELTGAVDVECKRSRNAPFSPFSFELVNGLPKFKLVNTINNF